MGVYGISIKFAHDIFAAPFNVELEILIQVRGSAVNHLIFSNLHQVGRCNFKARPAESISSATFGFYNSTDSRERNSGSFYHTQSLDGVPQHS